MSDSPEKLFVNIPSPQRCKNPTPSHILADSPKLFSSAPLCSEQPSRVFPQLSPSNRPTVALTTKNSIKVSKGPLSPVTSLTPLTRKIPGT